MAACLAEHGGFSHNAFAIELVETLETRYTTHPGLNLSREVLSGQQFRITHAGETPLLEVQVVDLADSIAYNAHDVDDALALKLLDVSDLRSLDLVQAALEYGEAKGHSRTAEGLRQSLVHSLIDVQVVDVLSVADTRLSAVADLDSRAIRELGIKLELSPVVASQREQLARFLFDHVYRHKTLVKIRQQAAHRVTSLFECLLQNPKLLPNRFRELASNAGPHVAAGQYIAGMTDRFCDHQHTRLINQGASRADAW